MPVASLSGKIARVTSSLNEAVAARSYPRPADRPNPVERTRVRLDGESAAGDETADTFGARR
jgi:hypothetical protein